MKIFFKNNLSRRKEKLLVKLKERLKMEINNKNTKRLAVVVIKKKEKLFHRHTKL